MELNGRHKQYILLVVDIIFNYVFHVGLQENVFRQILKTRTLGLGGAGTEKVYFRTCLKTCSWKSNTENVIKYGAYLDVVLMVSIYVTTC